MKFLLFLCVIVWLSVTAGGLFFLARYQNTPAKNEGVYPSFFPEKSRLERDPGQPALLFFAHPKCPCTRASLRELARLMTDVNGKLPAFVIFIKPPDAGRDWTETDLRTSAELIPNVRVVIDESGSETKIFNAQTSGLVLLYDRQGNLRFNGGITASRGHEGDNAGRRAIFEIVTEKADEAEKTPVFGCPLHNKDCQGELIEYAQ